ncbi:MAG: DUF2325 domain-containing protein [Alphaproteobacteria bacterium]|nr:DUF2325 domain-containing protein [Alphaproteobacteria bacterium]
MTVVSRLDLLTLRLKGGGRGPVPVMPNFGVVPTLVKPSRQEAALSAPCRTKIWELSNHLHCSIVGTCLSTAELKQIVDKAGFTVADASDHDLHGRGVQIASQPEGGAKLLHKALDKRHRVAIAQFDKAKTVDEVRMLWRDAVGRGDIPGAYWSTLTHAAATSELIREVFGEVHMLSHLVGAANRADIRRLSELEAQNAELQDTLRRQQAQLREGFTARDAQIQELSTLLSRRLAEGAPHDDAEAVASEKAALTRLVRDLDRRLTQEQSRRTGAEKRASDLAEELRLEREARAAAERREAAMHEDIEAVEASLASAAATEDAAQAAPASLDGLTVLYVGGRPTQLVQLKALSERHGAAILHHDGGIEDRSGLLAGLVSRADVVMFPVDCVSHEAVLVVKRLCRNATKPYVALRSASLSAFSAAIHRLSAPT